MKFAVASLLLIAVLLTGCAKSTVSTPGTPSAGALQFETYAEAAIAVILAEAKRGDEADKAQLLSIQADGLQETVTLANEKLRSDQEHALLVAANDESIRVIAANTQSVIDRMNAIQPGLISALTFLGETELMGKLTANFNVQSILGGTSISETLQRTFAGTRFANLLEQVNHTGNGQPHPAAPATHARRD